MSTDKVQKKELQRDDSVKAELLEIINILSKKNIMRLLYSARGLQKNGE